MFRSSTSSCYILILHKTIRDNDLQHNNVALKMWSVGAQTRPGFRNPRRFCFKWYPKSITFLLWNSESWALESGIQLKGSGIPLMIGIRNPSSTLKKSGIQYLKSGIQGVEFRIQTVLDSLTWREQTIFCTIFALQVFRVFEQAVRKLKHQITNSAKVYPINIPVINVLHNAFLEPHSLR